MTAGLEGAGFIQAAVGGLVRHLPGDSQRRRDLQLLDVAILRRKLAGELKVLLRDGGHPELIKIHHADFLEQIGIIEGTLEPLKQRHMKAGDRDPIFAGAAAANFSTPSWITISVRALNMSASQSHGR